MCRKLFILSIYYNIINYNTDNYLLFQLMIIDLNIGCMKTQNHCIINRVYNVSHLIRNLQKN